jgi:hypothetical protein
MVKMEAAWLDPATRVDVVRLGYQPLGAVAHTRREVSESCRPIVSMPPLAAHSQWSA